MNTSALNRPFDDLSVARIRLEADAVAMLIAAVEDGRADLASSEYSVFEASRNPDPDRALKVLSLLRLARVYAGLSPHVRARAQRLEEMGFRGLDALHVASAEAAKADKLVATDDRMIRAARRAGRQLSIGIVSPVEALALLSKEESDEE